MHIDRSCGRSDEVDYVFRHSASLLGHFHSEGRVALDEQVENARTIAG